MLKEERDRSSRLAQEVDNLNAQVDDLNGQVGDLKAGVDRLSEQLTVLTRIMSQTFS